jgi:GNAT superfamily N-acetyltransferase
LQGIHEALLGGPRVPENPGDTIGDQLLKEGSLASEARHVGAPSRQHTAMCEAGGYRYDARAGARRAIIVAAYEVGRWTGPRRFQGRTSNVKPGVLMSAPACTLRFGRPDDVSTIFGLIQGLAEYERLSDAVVGSEDLLREHLFGARTFAEVLLAEVEGRAVGFALFFHNYSTFLTRPGVYLEDLFVLPEERGRGYGKALLAGLARLAFERGCGRLEWSVLNWNEPSIQFYRALGAVPMDEWTVNRVTGEALERLAQQGPPVPSS